MAYERYYEQKLTLESVLVKKNISTLKPYYFKLKKKQSFLLVWKSIIRQVK